MSISTITSTTNQYVIQNRKTKFYLRSKGDWVCFEPSLEKAARFDSKASAMGACAIYEAVFAITTTTTTTTTLSDTEESP